MTHPSSHPLAFERRSPSEVAWSPSATVIMRHPTPSGRRPRTPLAALLVIAVLLVLAVAAVGCERAPSRASPTASPKPQTFAELYPGDLAKVTRIVMTSGSDGVRKAVSDPDTVAQWTSAVSGLVLTPDPNQEGRVGYLYNVTLWEGAERKLSFIPGSINGVWYLDNPTLRQTIANLYRSDTAVRLNEGEP